MTGDLRYVMQLSKLLVKSWPKLSQWWLWLTVLAIPFSVRQVVQPVFHQGEFVDYASSSLFLSDLLIVGLLLIWLIDWRQTKFSWGPRWLTYPLLALGAWMWVSLLWADVDLLIGLQSALRFSLYIGLYFYLVNRVTDIRLITYPLVVGVTLQGVIALGQYFTNHSLGLKWLGESVLDPAKSGIPVVMTDGVRQLRAHGTLPHANTLGGYLAFSLALIWPWVASQRKLTSKLLTSAVLLIGLSGWLLSFSRGAWLTFILGGVIVLVWWVATRRQVAWINLSVAMALLLVLVISQWSAITSRWSTHPGLVEQISIESRERQLTEFRRIYSDHWLTGVGVGQYFLNIWQPTPQPSWQYQTELGGWAYLPDLSLSYYQPMHNVYLLALGELGPVGAGLWLWLLVAAGVIAIKLMRQGIAEGAAGLWAVLIIAGVSLVDHYYWTLPAGRLMVILGLGYLAVLWVNSSYNGKRGRTEA